MVANGAFIFQVLIYNFFHDSAMSETQWRLVFDAMSKENKSQRTINTVSEGGLCVEVLYFFSTLKY